MLKTRELLDDFTFAKTRRIQSGQSFESPLVSGPSGFSYSVRTAASRFESGKTTSISSVAFSATTIEDSSPR